MVVCKRADILPRRDVSGNPPLNVAKTFSMLRRLTLRFDISLFSQVCKEYFDDIRIPARTVVFDLCHRSGD